MNFTFWMKASWTSPLGLARAISTKLMKKKPASVATIHCWEL